jgi:erythromycin esterase-like protein
MLDEFGPDLKLVLWADNTHVTRAAGAMGSFLAERLRDDYLPVGLTFDAGRYSAYGPERIYPVQEGFSGTHEYVLSQHRRGDYLVALAALPPGHPLGQVAGFRYIGSRPQRLNQFQPLLLEEHFDIIGFTRTTEGTRDLILRDAP